MKPRISLVGNRSASSRDGCRSPCATSIRNVQEFAAQTAGMVADPSVTIPFFSILGGGDPQIFAAQAEAWHRAICSPRKPFALLDAVNRPRPGQQPPSPRPGILRVAG